MGVAIATATPMAPWFTRRSRFITGTAPHGLREAGTCVAFVTGVIAPSL
jgi:hypothetical protein